MVETQSKPLHRGRFQTQGGGVQKSVAWAQETAPTITDAHGMLDQLAAKLTPAELKDRELLIQQAHAFVDNAGRCGGVDAPVMKSWLKRRDIRIDLEVRVGRAFVPDT